MEFSAIEETRKVSFDDFFLNESVEGDDSSVEGLVTVPEESSSPEAPPFLPTFCNQTVDLYACFDPPQSPEQMRRNPTYTTLLTTPDYAAMYGPSGWRRVSVETAGSKRERDDHNEYGVDEENLYSNRRRRYSLRVLFTRFAHCIQRSEESRSSILQHHSEFSRRLDLRKEVSEILQNDTRRRILDMVRQELEKQMTGGGYGSTG